MAAAPAPPAAVDDAAALDELLSRPSAAVIESVGRGDGDLLVLGAGGKMGPTLARMARRAFDAAGRAGQVVAVSRFSDRAARAALEAAGVVTRTGDLLDPALLRELPDAPDVVFMAGRKFGSTGAEHLTWAMNAYLPGLVAARFRQARVAVFSTAAVYPFTAAPGPGADETLAPGPVGEYAQSCLARERMFEYAAHTQGARAVTLRLSYALDLRYGVALDIAQAIAARRPVALAMGCASVIWQGDACDLALRALELAQAPPCVLNLSGPQPVRVRGLAARLGELLGLDPVFQGQETDTALIVDCTRLVDLLGAPPTPLEHVLAWTAAWVRARNPTLDKPTHFDVRDGRF